MTAGAPPSRIRIAGPAPPLIWLPSTRRLEWTNSRHGSGAASETSPFAPANRNPEIDPPSLVATTQGPSLGAIRGASPGTAGTRWTARSIVRLSA